MGCSIFSCVIFVLRVFLLSFCLFFNCVGSDSLYAYEISIQNSKESVKKIKNKTNSPIIENQLFSILKKNTDKIEIVIYMDYYCFACDEVHKKIEYLKSKVHKLSVQYKVVTLSQKSVEAAYVALCFMDLGIFEVFNDLMYKIDYTERSAEMACAALGYDLSTVLNLNPEKLKLLKNEIYLNNKFLKEFSNGIAPLTVIKLFNKKKLIREIFITGDFSLASMYKTIQTLININ